jgi:hypothetical protein
MNTFNTIIITSIIFAKSIWCENAELPHHYPQDNFALIHPEKLAILKQPASNAHISSEIEKMCKSADDIIKDKKEFTVTFNNPKGQEFRNNYFSMGPYWWPNPDTENGLPYIRKDGRVNPERDQISDRDEIRSFIKAIEAMAIAYYATGNEKYAQYGIHLLEVWFLNNDTKMSPNMVNAQAIPGLHEGRGTGIIDSHKFIHLVDYITILKSSKSWSQEHEKAIAEWFTQFLNWLLTHKYGNDESDSKNNHGTAFDMQVIAIALHLKKYDWVKNRIQSHTIPRIDSQIEPTGEQPLETARTKSWNYICENLHNFYLIGLMAKKVGIDLFHYTNPSGGGYQAALNYAIPYTLTPKIWPHKMIVEFQIDRLQVSTNIAAALYEDNEKYLQYLKDLDWSDLPIRYFLKF